MTKNTLWPIKLLVSILFHQDTAGSERYESITRMYYRGAWAAIVCFDLTDPLSFQRAEFWINDLRKIEPVRTRLLLLLNRRIAYCGRLFLYFIIC